ncbi:MAG TPA: sulfatase-like hydrolase/transferase [Candidatus Sulfotelmatobacter sp.]|jgi:arylsulfatase A-like enzyme|nr:sulfatase-like hydrolase/transferase [Candidatus Sulfotelmatobacter sp.]
MPETKATPRLVFPAVGLALGAGLLFSESVLLIREFFASFGGGGVWRELLFTLAGYAVAGALIDLAAQLVAPARWRLNAYVRAAPVIVAAFLAQKTFGVASAVAFGSVPLAAVWASGAFRRWGWPMASGFAALALLPALPAARVPIPPPSAAREASGPNVLLVVLDTMRRDHVSAYGYDRPTTPHFDALAARGVKFDRAYASSCWSVPSHAGLFTGLLSSKHGADFEHFFLDEGVDTLAEDFAKNGWQTVGFSGNPYIAAGTGMSRGFGLFDESWRPHVTRRWLVGLQIAARMSRSTHDKGGGHVVSAFKQWFKERDKSRPYFAFVNLLEAHAPYQDAQLAAKFTDRRLSSGDLERIGNVSHEAQWAGTKPGKDIFPTTWDLVDGATASADAYLGEILDLVGDDTLIVVVSDHGDLVGEHDLWGHMTSLYETLIHVPMAIAGPGIPKGKVIPDMVSLLDVMPTVLGMVGIDAPPTDGTDLRDVIDGKVSLADRVVHAEHMRTDVATSMWALNRFGDELKSIRARRAAAVGMELKRIVAENGEDDGFDLMRDPGEEHPMPGETTGLSVAVPKPPPPRGPVRELDPAQIEALKSLGYMR